jgi:hypothetical protein
MCEKTEITTKPRYKMAVFLYLSARRDNCRTYGALGQYTINKCEAELKHA